MYKNKTQKQESSFVWKTDRGQTMADDNESESRRGGETETHSSSWFVCDILSCIMRLRCSCSCRCLMFFSCSCSCMLYSSDATATVTTVRKTQSVAATQRWRVRRKSTTLSGTERRSTLPRRLRLWLDITKLDLINKLSVKTKQQTTETMLLEKNISVKLE